MSDVVPATSQVRKTGRRRAAAGLLLVFCLAPVLAAPWLGLTAAAGSLLALAGVAAGVVWCRQQLRAELRQLLSNCLVGSGRAGAEQAEAAGGSALLAPVEDALKHLIQRQQVLFDAQAQQLEALRRQAYTDPLTGLFNRRHFMALLDGVLSGDGQPIEVGLLLLRVRDLPGMNQRIGHAGSDRVLKSLAQVLLAYAEGINRCSAGRLSGGDFVLLLPVSGVADETATTLLQALRQPVARTDPLARVQVGVVELSLPMRASQALALAESALGQHRPAAPARPPADKTPPLLDDELPADGSTWHQQITRALAKGEVALAAYPVRTPDGRQLHLDCPLRVRLHAQGPLETASRWLHLATRTRMCAALDERALQLALEAIAADGQARCINLAAQSLASGTFVVAVTRRLADAPQSACRLWIDLPESMALAQPSLVREAARRWRPLGVMLGLEHAGEDLARIPRLIDLGLDCVRIDSRFVNDLRSAEAESSRLHLQGLVKLVQAVGWQVTAEGVRSADDLELLWQLGFDAATGPAVTPEPAVAPAQQAVA